MRIEPRVLELLLHLLKHEPALLSKAQLLQDVWGTEHLTDWAISRAVADLRKVLRQHGGQPQWIGTVHGRGYRWQGPLNPLPATAPGAAETTGSTPAPRPAPSHHRTTWRLTLLAVLALAAWLWQGLDRTPSREQVPHLVVIPSASQSTLPPWMDSGLADEVLTRLSHQPELRVLSRGSGERLATAEDRSGAARVLGADHWLELSLRPIGEGLVAHASLTRSRDGVVIWAERYSSQQPRIADIGEQISSAVVRSLLQRGGRTQAKPLGNDAEIAFLRGRHLLHRRGSQDLLAALRFFDEAVAHDPDYAPAWAGKAAAHLLARTYFLQPAGQAWPQATEATRRALALDPQLADSHAVAGLLALNQDWDLAAARRHYARALQLAPSQLQALQWSAELAMFEGRDEQAEAWMAQAMALDPAAPVLIGIAGMLAAARGEHALARDRYAEALRLEPRFFWLYRELAYLAEREGRWSEAISSRIKEVRLRGYNESALASLLNATAEDARTGYYRWYLAEHGAGTDGEASVAQELIAEALAACGRHDEALEVLRQHGRQMGEALPHFLIRSPAFADPRYRRLAAELGLKGLRPAAS